jgi:hypothetical protein
MGKYLEAAMHRNSAGYQEEDMMLIKPTKYHSDKLEYEDAGAKMIIWMMVSMIWQMQ